VVSSCNGRALGTLGVSSFDGRCLAHISLAVEAVGLVGSSLSGLENGGARGDKSHLITTWRGSPRESLGSCRMRRAQRQSEVKVLSVCLTDYGDMRL
jgi:hypothetical protein